MIVKSLNKLVVNVGDIPAEGLPLELNVSIADMTAILEDGDQTPTLLSPLRGDLFLRPLSGDRLSIKGAFNVTTEIICDRCLADTPTELAGSVDEVLDLVTTPGGLPIEELEASDSDGELEVAGGAVNLSGLLGELFWIAWPWNFICKPDCAGLCQRCGADLNEGLCQCAEGREN